MKLKIRTLTWFLFFSFLVIGCSRQITSDEAISDEFLSMSPESYQGRGKKLRSESEEVLNTLFAASLDMGNVELAQYYLSIGANIETLEVDYGEFISVLINNNEEKQYHDLLIECLINYPDLFFWEIKMNNGAWESVLKKFAYELPLASFEDVLCLCPNVDYMDRDGDFALFSLAAAWRGVEDKKEKIELFLDAGADTSLTSPSGSNILHYFNWWPKDEDFSEILETFRQSGIDIDQQNDNGSTPLHWAVNPLALKTNSIEYVQYLVSHGADIELADYGGLYPVDGFSRYIRGFDSATPEEVSERKKILKPLHDVIDFRGVANPFEN